MILAHDQVATKSYIPELPEIPHEVDEDEESVKIVRIVKGNSEPLVCSFVLFDLFCMVSISLNKTTDNYNNLSSMISGCYNKTK